MLPYHQAEALWGWLLLFLMSRDIGSVLGLGIMLTLAQEAAGVLERCPDIHWMEVYYHPKVPPPSPQGGSPSAGQWICRMSLGCTVPIKGPASPTVWV
jgi:hypothetical protein